MSERSKSIDVARVGIGVYVLETAVAAPAAAMADGVEANEKLVVDFYRMVFVGSSSIGT